MQIQLLRIPGVRGFPASTILIDGFLALDAGLLGLLQNYADLAQIQHVVLTHAHMDHIAGLPMFLDTVYNADGAPPTIHGHSATLASLRAYIFNDQIMPDFIRMSQTMPAFLQLHELHADAPFDLGNHRLTPVALMHGVPCFGYFVQAPSEMAESKIATIAIITDTLPWNPKDHPLAQKVDVWFVECSFPDSLAQVALASHHLTVSDFLTMARSLPESVRVVPIHMKPRYAEEVLQALRASGVAQVWLPEEDLIKI